MKTSVALCFLVATASAALAAGDHGKAPAPIFESPLADVPGKHLVVVHLKFEPGKPSTAHRHPGSVYVYVTKGTVKLGKAGEPVQTVHAGESFFEPVGAVHTVGESASPTESAEAIAVMIVPDGQPLVLPQ